MSEIIPLYEQIVTDICRKIEQGLYHTGDKLDSLNKLCQRYGVSKITAIRAIDELQILGLVKKAAGKGSFVTGMRYKSISRAHSQQLKRLILFSSVALDQAADSSFTKQIYNSILSYACETGIDFQIKNIQESDVYGTVKASFSLQPDEGVIAIARNTIIPMLHLFTDPNSKRVLIDTSVAGVPNVLTDNFHGMKCILTHLYELGHRRVLFASRFAEGQNFVNENERLDAFINITDMMGMQGDVLTTGDLNEIYECLEGKDAPTAILFSRDDPAVKLIKNLQQQGMSVPGDISVVGFDDYIEETALDIGLTTYRVDTKGLAMNAVDSLRKPLEPKCLVPLTRRVKGQLIIRDSSGPVCKHKLISNRND